MDDLMLPMRPYLLPALYQWIIESGKTPYLLVDATEKEVAVPEAHIQNGQIVLSLAPQAIRDLEMDKKAVSFRATFSGEIVYIYVPMAAILSIYAAENGRGMPFEHEGECLAFDTSDESNHISKSSHLNLVD